LMGLDELLQDAIDEIVFLEQEQVGVPEQQRFERNLEQIESFVEDQLLVLRRRLTAAQATLRSSEDQRDRALGSDARTEAERKVRNTQTQIDELEAQIERLENRSDREYEKWRELANTRRFRAPEITRILEVEFTIE